MAGVAHRLASDQQPPTRLMVAAVGNTTAASFGLRQHAAGRGEECGTITSKSVDASLEPSSRLQLGACNKQADEA